MFRSDQLQFGKVPFSSVHPAGLCKNADHNKMMILF